MVSVAGQPALSLPLNQREMNTVSRYTHFIVYREHTILFHLPTDSVITLRPELADVLAAHRDDIDTLRGVHPELYGQMERMGMIVGQDIDEGEDTFRRWEAADSDPTRFSIIVNPTLDCNLRCWYCYEKNRCGTTMDDTTLQTLFRLVDKKTESDALHHLSVSFFGGEPLLPYRRIVAPLLEHASRRCRERGIELSTAFTTNGVLLEADVLDSLARLHLSQPPSFQITLDGNAEHHDGIRHTADGRPTYATIVRHIHDVARREWLVSLRFNYTHDNIDTFVDVLHDLADLTPEEKGRVACNFQQVWQDKAEHPETEEKARKLVATFRSEGYTSDCDGVVRRGNCYADAANCIVVNSDGNVFKCTARDFVPENSEGRLMPDGTLTLNERYHRRQALKYANPDCRACSILPICNGGCSQAKMERTEHEGCYYHLSETDKKRRVVERLKYVMSNHIKQ